MPTLSKTIKRHRRHNRIKSKLHGTNERPRLIVYRSLKYNYAQLIDDDKNQCLVASSDIKIKSGTKTERAKKIGLDLAEKALNKKITTCVFDRNGYKYHGRVKALADGARAGGLKF